MKVTTEKLPKSLLALEVELDKNRLERGLDQAARRLSQKYPVRGFRPGKAPRFIIERTFGRDALIEEASEDLINKSFREALQQEQIAPVGPASLQGVTSSDPFTFKVTVPVPPTVDVGDYRALRAPLELEPTSDEQVERALDVVRDRHVVLKELDEPRPAQEGDQLKATLETVVDGEPEPEPNPDEQREQTLDLVKGRLVDELYEGLLGVNVGESREIAAEMPDDHANEAVRGKHVTFKVAVSSIQERILPAWDELPTLENFEGSLDDLRAKTRADLETAARTAAERETTDSYIEQLVAQTSYDIPDVMVHELAHDMLHDQERQFSRYGITLEQMLQYRGQTHEQAVEALLPDAERQTKVTLALREVVRHENLDISDDEISGEVERLILDYDEAQRANVAQTLQGQLRSSVANAVLDRKLRERLLAIATGEAPALNDAASASDTSDAETRPATTNDASAVGGTTSDETAVAVPAEASTEETRADAAPVTASAEARVE